MNLHVELALYCYKCSAVLHLEICTCVHLNQRYEGKYQGKTLSYVTERALQHSIILHVSFRKVYTTHCTITCNIII